MDSSHTRSGFQPQSFLFVVRPHLVLIEAHRLITPCKKIYFPASDPPLVIRTCVYVVWKEDGTHKRRWKSIIFSGDSLRSEPQKCPEKNRMVPAQIRIGISLFLFRWFFFLQTTNLNQNLILRFLLHRKGRPQCGGTGMLYWLFPLTGQQRQLYDTCLCGGSRWKGP